jgi:hypothetical protein
MRIFGFRTRPVTSSKGDFFFSKLAWKTLKTETIVCRVDEVRTVAGAFNASQHVAMVQVEETWCDEKYQAVGPAY